MIYGIGTDITDIRRIDEMLSSYGDGFLARILSDAERAICPRRNEAAFLAGRFAAKEAVFKALGKRKGLSFRDVEILNDPEGKPYLANLPAVMKALQSAGVAPALKCHVSITHEREYAVAFVVMEVSP